jgi:hypothetical protein
LRWTSQKPKGKEGAKDDCCRESDFFHSAVNICRKTQKHRLGNVTISTHWGVCLGGQWGGFLDRICRIFQEITGWGTGMFGFEQFEGAGGWRETNLFRFRGLAQVIPASWDWQKKSKNRLSLLVEFLFLPCPIRIANALVPMSLDPFVFQ